MKYASRFWRNALGFLIFLCLSGPVSSAALPRMGINLSGPADWNTELPFVDVFRMSRPWISQQQGQAWGKGPALELDEHGWVKRLDAGCWAETLVNTIAGGHYPGGKYTVLYDGKGLLEASGGGRIIERQPGRLILQADPQKGAICLQLKQTDPSDYLRSICVLMPGFETSASQNPWHPVFLKRWSGTACLRFMDFMHTNNSSIVKWSDRPVGQDATFSEKGIALECMIDLANRLGADPWFCMPHQADDTYVRCFAEMVKERLDPELKVYIEYSNEVWNSIFAQHRWAQQQGLSKGFGHPERPWEAAWQYTSYRSVQIFKIWEAVFGGTDRLVRVLGGFAANSYVSEQVLHFQDACKQADALAIAPYISFNISPNSEPNSLTVQTWSSGQILTYLRRHSLPESIEWIKNNKKAAEKAGMKLIAYEAGQHLTGTGGGENNDLLTSLLCQANADPLMGDLYKQYLDAWAAQGGDLLCHFSSVSVWSKWGSWGLVEYYDSPPTPKYRSVVNWAAGQGQNMELLLEK